MTGICKASETAFATIDGTHSMTVTKENAVSELTYIRENYQHKFNLLRTSAILQFTDSECSSVLECDCIIDYRSGFHGSSTLSSEST